MSNKINNNEVKKGHNLRRNKNHIISNEINTEMYKHYYQYSNNETNNNTFPLHADITIHYRCSDKDNLRYPGMGLLSFTKLIKYISGDAKYIYVHTEGRHRGQGYSHERYLKSYCYDIVHALYEYLILKFPNTTIVVKTGAHIYDVLYDIINSKISTICSPSTFCLHGAIGKTFGSIYYPNNTPNYGGRDTLEYKNWYYMDNINLFHWPKNVSSSLDMIRILKN